jgi:hypothetical protein
MRAPTNHPFCLGFSMINPAIVHPPISGNPRSRQGSFVKANSLVGAPADRYAVAVEDGEVRGWGALKGRWFNSGYLSG